MTDCDLFATAMTESEVRAQLAIDIPDMDPDEARKRWGEAFGFGTCPRLIRDGKEVHGFYRHDYERFMRLVRDGEPTHFD